MTSRLILGTAQLGMEYGINNRSGQPNEFLAREIISCALDLGIKEFDTAQAYGTSEEVLGRALASLSTSKNSVVVTKLDPTLDPGDADSLRSSFKKSLSRLKIALLDGIMVHNENWLGHWDQGLSVILEDFIRQGLVRRIGVSVYSPDRALEALDKAEVSFIQIPSNILDLRFEKAGVFEKAERSKKLVYVRSVFLQGILCMDLEDLPARMSFAKKPLERFHTLARHFNIEPSFLALGYALAKWPHSFFVLGAETPEQVIKNVNLAKEHFPGEWVSEAEMFLGDVDERIISPMAWPK